MYVRLADVPVPRRLWWWLLFLFLVVRSNRRALKAAGKTGQDLGESVATRWAQVDADTAAMLRLTQTMVRLTWAVVGLTVVVIAATMYLGLR
jgi:hypothetical protein